MPSAAELAAQQEVTRAFIQERGAIALRLTPQVREPNGSGGFRLVAGPDRPPITCTLIPQSQFKGSAGPTRTADGEADNVEYILLAEVGATVQEDDFWEDGKWRWTVEYLLPDNGYEVKAAVSRYGT